MTITITPNLILPFSKQYKGMELKDVEEGFLKWVAFATKEQTGGPSIIFKGTDWSKVAKIELSRRAHPKATAAQLRAMNGLTGDTDFILPGEGLPTNSTDETVDIEVAMGLREAPQSERIPEGPEWVDMKNQVVNPTIQAMDDASLSNVLLKKFLTRKDRNKPLSEWLTEYAHEAVTYGKPVMGTKEDIMLQNAEQGQRIILGYDGFHFAIEYRKGFQLIAIGPE